MNFNILRTIFYNHENPLIQKISGSDKKNHVIKIIMLIKVQTKKNHKNQGSDKIIIKILSGGNFNFSFLETNKSDFSKI